MPSEDAVTDNHALFPDNAAFPDNAVHPRDTPTFTILVHRLSDAAYQTEAYLAETITSLLAQSRRDWELVVVDNGRSEEIAKVVGDYLHDPRIRLVRQQNRASSG